MMAFFDRFRSQPVATPSSELVIGEVLDKYDLVEVVEGTDRYDPFVIVAEKPSKELRENVTDPVDITEIGTSSPSPFTSQFRREYNRELQGIKGLQRYDQMRKSDGTVRGTLRMIKTPVLSARWFIEPGGQTKKQKTKKVNKTAADFVWYNLTELMSISWPQVLSEALLCADFGYYMFEKVWEPRIIDGVERMVLAKLAPRHPMDVKEWKYDANGGPAGVVMYTPRAGEYGYNDEVYIPISKLLVFTFDREAGNIEGVSALRSAYKHWYYLEQLYKIDAIQKERHGIGIPVIKLPPGFSRADKIAANDLGRNLRTNERAHVVLPPNWDLVFAKLEGQPVDSLSSVKVHQTAIRENILVQFLGENTVTKEEDQTMFLKATRFIADIVCDTFNLYLIPDMIKYNFDRADNPRLRARRIGEQADWRTLSFAIRNLIGAGVIRPDDTLEEYLREEMDLPAMDLETVRIVNTPQAGQPAPSTLPNATPGQGAVAQVPADGKQQGAVAGLPRQSPLPPVGPPAANAGTDRSGK